MYPPPLAQQQQTKHTALTLKPTPNQHILWPRKYNTKYSEIGEMDSSGAVWELRWPSWAFRPNEPYGFCGRKDLLNHASALVSACP